MRMLDVDLGLCWKGSPDNKLETEQPGPHSAGELVERWPERTRPAGTGKATVGHGFFDLPSASRDELVSGMPVEEAQMGVIHESSLRVAEMAREKAQALPPEEDVGEADDQPSAGADDTAKRSEQASGIREVLQNMAGHDAVVEDRIGWLPTIQVRLDDLMQPCPGEFRLGPLDGDAGDLTGTGCPKPRTERSVAATQVQEASGP